MRRPVLGDPLPSHLRDYAGVVIFGGPMSANDERDFIRQEMDLIGVALKEDVPYLGLCLGAQLMARHLGHRVYEHHEGRAEIGYYPIRPTEAAHRLCPSPFPDHVYQWHREGFDLPTGARLLAEGDDFAVQGCSLGKAFGFQFHPEVTYAMMCRWTVKAAERMSAPGARLPHQHLWGWHQHDAPVARWIDAFLGRWLKGGDAGAGMVAAE